MGSTDSYNCHPRRKRRRREESRARHKEASTKNYGVLSFGNQQRFKFLLLTCVMNNMICLFFTISLTLPFFSASVHGQQPRPSPAGFLDFENLPVTRFSCDGKVIGGYYADVETGCQMFHVCTLGQKDEIQDIKFLCVNGTVFDQETRVCERVDEVDCSQAEKFYDLNLDLYVPYVTTTKSTEESPTSTTTTTTTTTTTPTPPPAINFSQFRPMQAYLTTTRFHNPHQHQMHTQPPKPTNHGGNGGKFSSFSYYQRNPPSRESQDITSSSITSSGYNSNLRQSYLINHNEQVDEPDGNPTGRKVPNGVKTILYNNHHHALQRNLTNKPTPLTTTTTTLRSMIIPEVASTEEPEYYDEEYSDSAAEDSSSEKDVTIQEDMKHHRHNKKLQANQNSREMSMEIRGSSSNETKVGDQHHIYYDDDYGEETPASEYYDEDHTIINPNEHHFTHVDVPRIPFAKPNEPRVLVTNGKPFLPRLRRQSHLHNISKPHFIKIPTDLSATNLFLY